MPIRKRKTNPEDHQQVGHRIVTAIRHAPITLVVKTKKIVNINPNNQFKLMKFKLKRSQFTKITNKPVDK